MALRLQTDAAILALAGAQALDHGLGHRNGRVRRGGNQPGNAESRIDGAPALAASIYGDEEIAGKQRACEPFHLTGRAAPAGVRLEKGSVGEMRCSTQRNRGWRF